MQRRKQEEDPEARDYRLLMSRKHLRFLQSRLLLQPLEECLGTDSDYKIEKAVLRTKERTNVVRKFRRLEVGAGSKFLARADAVVAGSRARYKHPALELLREDVRWTIERIWKCFCQLPPTVVQTLFVCSDGKPQRPLVRQQQGARQVRCVAAQAGALDQLAIWVGLFRERLIIGDPAARRILQREIPNALSALRPEFGKDLAFVASEVLLHGVCAHVACVPQYFVVSEDEDKIILRRNPLTDFLLRYQKAAVG